MNAALSALLLSREAGATMSKALWKRQTAAERSSCWRAYRSQRGLGDRPQWTQHVLASYQQEVVRWYRGH